MLSKGRAGLTLAEVAGKNCCLRKVKSTIALVLQFDQKIHRTVDGSVL